jgi:hypothetical protein
MLTGKCFRLAQAITGIQLVNGTAKLISIPTGVMIKVLSGPNANGKLHDKSLVYVLWEKQTVALFAVDVEARGVEARPPGSDGLTHEKSATA